MRIRGLNKTTLLDYPRHLAATIFIGGCNMRCPFCHNSSLVLRPVTQPEIPMEEVLDYLGKRNNILEGVCITGGEPTLYPELPEFIRQIKSLGLKVKLDTNGTNPKLLQSLVNNKLIDYVAMDIKNSKEHYKLSIGLKDFHIDTIDESVQFLKASPLEYEFRTTVVMEHHSREDMISIGQWLQGASAYYLQPFKDSGDILLPGLTAPKEETLLDYKELLTPYIENVGIRG